MADQKLSALTATTSVIGTDEFYINDGGVSKKVTGTNLIAQLLGIWGLTATVTEVNYTDGVTSNIQTQLDAKQATITGAATTIDDADLTASRALVSDGSGKVAVSSVTSTELGYLSGVSSAVQTQLNAKSSNFVSSYASTGQTITSAGLLTLAHSLGAEPKAVQLVIQCTSGEFNYTTGERVIVAADHSTSSVGFRVDATNITIRFTNAASVFYIPDKTTGASANLTNSSWQLYVYAYA